MGGAGGTSEATVEGHGLCIPLEDPLSIPTFCPSWSSGAVVHSVVLVCTLCVFIQTCLGGPMNL